MRQLYKCQNCGETDSDAGNNALLQPPKALICNKCKSGRGMSPDEQVARGVGMLPVGAE
jgi:hypothetical protein